MIGFLASLALKGAGLLIGMKDKQGDRDLALAQTYTGADTDRQRAYYAALTETNRLRAGQAMWWGAKAIIVCAGIPASLHMGAVFLDSLPFPTLDLGWRTLRIVPHVIGSWGIPKPPAPYDEYQWALVQSFFLVGPVMPVLSAVADRLRR